MKTKKYYTSLWFAFEYISSNHHYIYHGLENSFLDFKYIGYHYQDNRKGFWLISKK